MPSPYCSVDQVRAVVVTALTDAQITDLVHEVDKMIEWRYDLTGVPALVIQRASRLKTAYVVMLRDPNARRIGEYSEDRSKIIAAMKQESDEALADLSSGGAIEAFNEPID